MGRSPDICLKCGHTFPPGVPESSWCPDCGKLCSADDQPEDPEPHRWREVEGPSGGADSVDNPAERRRWLNWFWVLFLLGLVMAVLTEPMTLMVGRAVPSWLQPKLGQTGEFLFSVLAPLIVAALGAAFCLVRSRWWRGSFAGRIAATFFLAFGLLITYAGIVSIGCLIAMNASR